MSHLKVPSTGQKIQIKNGKLVVPDQPIVPFIEGDGIGPDIWAASVRVLDTAVQKAYNGKKKISWFEVYAGEKAKKVYGNECPPNFLPDETVSTIK